MMVNACFSYKVTRIKRNVQHNQDSNTLSFRSLQVLPRLSRLGLRSRIDFQKLFNLPRRKVRRQLRCLIFCLRKLTSIFINHGVAIKYSPGLIIFNCFHCQKHGSELIRLAAEPLYLVLCINSFRPRNYCSFLSRDNH